MLSAGDILSLFGGASGGTAIVFCVLFISGIIVPKGTYDEMREQRDEYKRAYEIERARSDAGVLAAHVARDVLTGLHNVAAGKELE